MFFGQDEYFKPGWDLFEDIQDNPEHKLFDSTINEFTEISGFPVLYYIKKKITDPKHVDYLFGEAPNAEWSEPYNTRILYTPTEEKSMLDVFGIQMDEFIEGVHIPVSMWERDVKYKYNEESDLLEPIKEPMVGDVVKLLWNNTSYEIVDVGAEERIFQAKKMVYEFILRPYRYSEEIDDKVLFADDDFPELVLDREEDKDLDEYGENTNIGEEARENYDYDGKNTRKLYGYDVL